MTATDSPPLATRRAWIGLAVLALPTMLLALDISVLHLAAPHLSADLGPNSTQLLWILDIYGFMIAGFLVTMGTLGDRIGRRKLLMIGATAFGLASIAAAYSTSAEMLIAMRALLGIAGATLMPSTLALISNMFPNPRQRASAVGVWITSFMAGAALGPVVGGLLLEWFWWGSAFLIGVPVMALLLIAAPLLLPEYRDPKPGKLDLVSVGLSLAAAMPLVYGLKELAKDGLETVPLLALVFGALMGLVFVRRQRVLASPLMDLRLFRNVSFAAALTLLLLTVLAMGGVMLFAIQYLQMVEDLSALHAGLWMLPVTLGTVVGSMGAAPLAQRIAPWKLISGGLLLASVGYGLMAATAGDGILHVVITLLIVSVGQAPMMVLGTDLVLGSAPPEKAGAASSLSETASELGMALGVAILGTVGASVYRSQMDGASPEGVPEAAAGVAEDSLPGALTVAGELPAESAAALLGDAREAFSSGLGVTAATAAVIALAITALAAVALRHIRPGGPADHAGAGAEDGTGSGPEAAAGAEAQAPSEAGADADGQGATGPDDGQDPRELAGTR